MAAITYSEQLPDYQDLDNRSGQRPGYTVEINDQDGGVGIYLVREGEPAENSRGVWLTIDEAEKMLAGLREAIARGKNR